MITPRLRPRLDMTVPLPPRDLCGRVKRHLAGPECPCHGRVTEHQIDLRIRATDQHFWSPQLTVIIRPDGENASTLTGHFGPNANLWTLFLAAYAFVSLSATAAVFYGLAQMVLGETPWALVSIPVAMVLIAMIYVAAGIGQRLGHDQVDLLQRELEAALEKDNPPTI